MSKNVDVDHEHVFFNEDGSVKGLYSLDTDRLSGDLWNKIDNVVKEYTKLHPSEIQLLLAENAAIRESRENDTGSGVIDGNVIRWGVSIPAALMFSLEMVEPDLFSNKKLFHTFMQKYKGFRTCKLV